MHKEMFTQQLQRPNPAFRDGASGQILISQDTKNFIFSVPFINLLI